eukprot:Skav201601  [mRNA]  locus=scaffold152:827478:836949:+ [translate_table: standard]
MGISEAEKPLLGDGEVAETSVLVQIAFLIIGLATSVVWNQLMLCVVVLTELFGKSALAKAATAQNAFCAAAMLLLTFGQRLAPKAQMSGKGRLLLCTGSLLAMLCFGVLLASLLDEEMAGAQHIFLLIVLLALAACVYLLALQGAQTSDPAQTVGECIMEGGPAREYVVHRVCQ